MKLSLFDSIDVKMTPLEQTLQNYPRGYITDIELAALLGGSANRRYSMVKRWLAQGKLLPMRRGLYALTGKLGYVKPLDPFEFAQPIYGPSYISLESALSYHGLIPEAVYAVTSVCVKPAKNFETPLCLFTYSRLPLANFYIGVERVERDKHYFLMAKPWKAICDYVYCYKKNWIDATPLIESLRIEEEVLPFLSEMEKESLDAYYHSQRISCFLKGLPTV
jgi:hypothetical protein